MVTLQKLSRDTGRYLEMLNQIGSCKKWELLFVVDYWPVAFYRLQELTHEQCFVTRWLLKVLIWHLKPIIEGFTGARIRLGAKIGPGFVLFNSFGVTVASGSVIGSDCTVYSGVFVAHKANGRGQGVPIIGNNVTLMSGCKVLGDIAVGDNAIIGANAVVIKDVPPNAVVVGIPATVIS